MLALAGCRHMPKIPRLIPTGTVSEHADTAGEASKTISAATGKIMNAQAAIAVAASKVGTNYPAARPDTDKIIVHAEESTGEAIGINSVTVLLDKLQGDLTALAGSVSALEGEKADLAIALDAKDVELVKLQQDTESKRQQMYMYLTAGLIGLGAVILAVCLGYLRSMPGAAMGGILMASGLAMWALQPYLPWIVGGTVILVLVPYIYQLYDHDKHRCALEEQIMNEDPGIDHAVKSHRTENLIEDIRHKAKRKFKPAGAVK